MFSKGVGGAVLIHTFYVRTQAAKIGFCTIYNGEISNENLAEEEKHKGYLYAQNADVNPYSPSWYTLNFVISVRVTFWVFANLAVWFGCKKAPPQLGGFEASGRLIR